MGYQKLINENIKRLRKSVNLTQEEFAEKIGLSVQGLRNLEQNKYQPTADTIDLICSAFKITPLSLLIGETSKEKAKLLDHLTEKLSICSIEELFKINDLIDILNKNYR